MAPDEFPREQERAYRASWKEYDATTRRSIWRSVSKGQAVADQRYAEHAVWLARRLRRGLPLQGASGLMAGLILASMLYRSYDQPAAALLALAAGIAQPVIALRRYRRAEASERLNAGLGAGRPKRRRKR
ncbi:MAG: hypothetical protein ACRDJO_01735 [Actinomycetota bacterium]